VRARMLLDRSKNVLRDAIADVIDQGSVIYTDELTAYPFAIGDDYAHKVVNHLEKYVDGAVHVQGMENFWSLLKRGLNGTYIAVEPFHLFRYVDEQAFRYNNRRDMNDADRFSLAVSQIVGKRLTYAELTGKTGETEVF